jgi:hypothetical protein
VLRGSCRPPRPEGHREELSIPHTGALVVHSGRCCRASGMDDDPLADGGPRVPRAFLLRTARQSRVYEHDEGGQRWTADRPGGAGGMPSA